MPSHRIYFGKGAQALVTIPYRAGAPVRVVSGTYGIVDTRYSIDADEHVIVAAGTAASIDAASTTTTAAAGRSSADPRALTLVSTAALSVGSKYLLSGDKGNSEVVRIAAIASATVARTASEIRGQYATGASLLGLQVSATFPADPAADDDNLDNEAWVIVWSFAGMPPIREAIHLERGEEAQLATLDDLQELDPDLSKTGGDRVDPSAALARAHKDLRVDLQMAGVEESDLLTGPLGRDAVCYRAAHLALSGSEDIAGERKAAAYQARYLEIRASIVAGVKKPGVVSLDKETQQERAFNPAALFYGFGIGKGRN